MRLTGLKTTVTFTAFVMMMLVSLFAAGTGRVFAAPSGSQATVTGINLVSSTRTGRTTYNYTYTINVQNGSSALTGATATVTSSSPNTVVLSGTVAIGNLAANASTTTSSTFTIQQNLLFQFTPSSLTWVITGSPAQVLVPNVVGSSQAAATTAITGAGLVVGTVTTASSGTVASGNVISESPVAGTSVNTGSAVSIVVSTGPAQVSVPNVVGLTQAAASTSITGAGLVVGTVTTASSGTVASGNVISESPVAGTSVNTGSAVSIVVSTGASSAPTPASLTLALSQYVVSAGTNLTITPTVLDTHGNPITPTPAVTYSIAFNGNETSGPTPGLNGSQIDILTGTHGSFTLTGTVNGTAVQNSTLFTVVSAGNNFALYGTLGLAQSNISSNLSAILAALQNNNTTAIPALNSAMTAAIGTVNLDGLSYSDPVQPDTGFLPTAAQVAAVFPTVADDATYANLIPQISSQLQQITTLLNSGTLNSARFAILQGYLTNLTTLQAQLAPLNPSPNTAVQLHDQLNGILAIDLPQVTAAIVAQGNAQLTAASLASNQADPASFYRQIESAGAFRLAAAQAPAAHMYGEARHTQLVELLVVGFEEEVDAMELVKNIYGPILHQLGRMTALMALNDLTQQYLNSLQIDGMITGASQSFQVFGAPDSLVEIEGSTAGTSRPDLYNTWLIGSDQIAAAEGIITSFNPTKIKTIDDLWNFFQGVIDAVNAGGESAAAAHQNPDGALPEGSGSCFFFASNCVDLTWSNGFKSVQTGNVLAIGNVLVLVKSPNGGWSTGQFDFVGQ